MKVAHIGNVANIAYLNTKFLRRKGIAADVYVHDYGTTCLSCPEWEEGDFDAQTVPMQNPDWSKVAMRNRWQRPEWVKSAPPLTWHWLPYAKINTFVEQMEQKLNTLLKERQYHIIRESLRRRSLPELDFAEATRHFDIYRWEQMVTDYDIVVAYGAEPINCLIDYPTKPYVAVDYGPPLRDMIWRQSGPYHPELLRASYEMADCVVLTNPDIRPIVEKLNIKNYVFVPHPVDETTYAPGPSQIRADLEARYGRDIVVLFAPARHDWDVKGNDKMIRAVALLAREYPNKIVLILNRWGNDIEKSKDLLQSERIADKVIWLPLITKLQMVEYYRAADIVLDQFNIGTFGLTAPEAMACAKPVILHFAPHIHRWCFSEMPPVLEAQTSEEIFEHLRQLVRDPDSRQRIGQKSREWIIAHHGWEHVADLHVRIYQKILRA